MPSDLAFKVLNGFHRAALTVTGGRLGNRLLGMPVVELTTTGRKTGQRRTVMLTTPLQDGDALVLVASKGGDDDHPAWLLNLQADPDVEVRLTGEAPRRMRARVTEGDERAELWTRLTAAHPNYAGYQRKTTRQIPVVVLEPPG